MILWKISDLPSKIRVIAYAHTNISEKFQNFIIASCSRCEHPLMTSCSRLNRSSLEQPTLATERSALIIPWNIFNNLGASANDCGIANMPNRSSNSSPICNVNSSAQTISAHSWLVFPSMREKTITHSFLILLFSVFMATISKIIVKMLTTIQSSRPSGNRMIGL